MLPEGAEQIGVEIDATEETRFESVCRRVIAEMEEILAESFPQARFDEAMALHERKTAAAQVLLNAAHSLQAHEAERRQEHRHERMLEEVTRQNAMLAQQAGGRVVVPQFGGPPQH